MRFSPLYFTNNYIRSSEKKFDVSPYFRNSSDIVFFRYPVSDCTLIVFS